jgi:hypothetical protein
MNNIPTNATLNPTHNWIVYPNINPQTRAATPFVKTDRGTTGYTVPDAANAGQIDTVVLPVPTVQGNAAVVQSVGAPTDAQCTAALGLDTLGSAKTAQIAKVSATFNATVAAISATGGGLSAVFAGDFITQGKLNGLVQLWQEADTAAFNSGTDYASSQAASAAFEATSVTVYDINGAPVTGTIGQLRALISNYGQQAAVADLALYAKVGAIKAATTVEAVQAIT